MTATAAIAVDVDSGRIYYAKDIHRRLAMASTTKITTALTALNIAGFNPDEKATVDKADLVGEASMGLRAGETLTLRTLLYGLLLNSGNDAAMTIARHMGAKLPGSGDPIARFVAQMNTNAAAWGYRNTHFINPHGLDADGHYSSAFDLAVAGWHALHTPLLAQIVATQTYTAEGHTLTTVNTFLKSYTGATGVKPGLTDAAGLCLVASAQHGGHTALVVILNTRDLHADANNLMDYTFARLGDTTDDKSVSVPGGGAAPLDRMIGTVKANTLAPVALDATGKPIVSVASADTIIDAAVIPMPSSGTKLSSATNPTISTGQGLGGPGVVAAQVVPTTDSGTAPATDATPGDATATGSPAKGGGPNVLVILLVLLVIAAAVFFAARQGFLGAALQDRAGRLDDSARRSVSRSRDALARPRPAPPASGAEDDPPPHYAQTQHTPGEPQMPLSHTVARPAAPLYPPPVQPRPPRQPDEYADAPLPPTPLRATQRTADPPPTPQARPTIVSTAPVYAEPSAETASASPQASAFKVTPLNAQVIDEVWLANRARQAIAYTAAGRYQAGYDEFRRVVENAPLFDFGDLPEFADMSLVGYRALAQAYLHVDRPRFAVLLLEMAIEHYPNDLELRSGLRNLKKELGIA